MIIFSLDSMGNKKFVPSRKLSVESGVEAIRILVAEPINDGILNFGIGLETLPFQVILQRPEEMGIPSCEIRALDRMLQYVPSETIYSTLYVDGCCHAK